MAQLIEFSDVAQGHKPAIPDEDKDYVYELIKEAVVELEVVVGDLGQWIAAAKTPEARERRETRVKTVLKRMVRRVLRNPEGYLSESDGDYSYSRARDEGQLGDIVVTGRDRRTLGLGGGIRPGSIRVGLPADSPRNQTSQYRPRGYR